MSVVNIEGNENAFFTTGKVEGNEIVKADDFNFSFTSLVDNISKFSRMIFESKKDFVIGGKVTVDSDTNVKVAPVFGVCMSTGKCFGIAEELQGVSFAVEQGPADRIDILEIRGASQDYDQQQRAFNDLDNDTITYQTIETKTGTTIEVAIKQGSAGSAPSVDAGWVKLCEIHYTANATELDDEDIYNITADVSTMDNDDWTTDIDCVYNIGYISDVNERFRVQHNEDGTHKANIIGTNELNAGTGSGQVNGDVLPVGGSVSIPTQTVSSTDSILAVMTKLAVVITSLYNAYLKYGTYGLNGELSISSDLVTGTTTLKNPISLYAAGDGTAEIRINGTAVLSIDAQGRLTTNGYTANANNNLVTKAVTDQIASDLATLDAYVRALAPQIDNSTYVNGTLSAGTDGRYHVYTSVDITRASTENIATLSGMATIDGSSPTNGDLILLKNQTDKTQNGIWTYNETGDWSRPNVAPSDFSTPDKLIGLIFNIKGGSANAGRMFYMPKVVLNNDSGLTPPSPTFALNDIEFLEYFGSIEPIAERFPLRDDQGCVRTAMPTNPYAAVPKIYAAPLVVNASPAVITNGPALQTNMSLTFFFTANITGSNGTAPLTITYNSTSYAIKAPVGGSKKSIFAHEISSGNFRYIDAYTTIQVIYDGTYFVVVGNPVVLSSSNYTIYADGYKYEKTRNITSESVTAGPYATGVKFVNKQMPSTGSLYLVHISLTAYGYNTPLAFLAIQNGYVTDYRYCNSGDEDSKYVSLTYFIPAGGTVSIKATNGSDVRVESGSIQYVKVI